jgi:hypothetical protein
MNDMKEEPALMLDSVYLRLGGEQAIHALVDRFYALQRGPDASMACRHRAWRAK